MNFSLPLFSHSRDTRGTLISRDTHSFATISQVDLKLATAIFIGKTVGFFTKLTGGGATAAPGLYALKIDPKLVRKISQKNQVDSIIISGTNGKTTTSRLTFGILSAKYKIIHNRQGSNLLRGIASTLISQSSISGKIEPKLAIWEVDEAALPKVIENTKPTIVVLLNLFRDQLDRYGETDTTRNKWQKSLSILPKETVLIANADDPQIGFIAQNFKGRVIFFGINETKLELPEISHVADIKHCLNCGSKLEYQTILSSHMGHYSCPNCSFIRPNPNIYATKLKFNPNFSTSLKLNFNSQLSTLNYNLPGLYNVYNILAAISVANFLGIERESIKTSISNFSAAFGRFQKIKIAGKNAVIFLIKNPTGANEVLRILSQKKNLDVLVILNDKIADGRDVSWIWDTNWEVLSSKVNSICVSGTRAWDMASRLKYAGFKLSKNNVEENILSSINFTVKNMDTKNTLIILPTYTALLSLQKLLPKMGDTTKWHED